MTKIVDIVILITSIILCFIAPYSGSDFHPISYELKEGTHIKAKSKVPAIDITESQTYTLYDVTYSNGKNVSEHLQIYVKMDDVDNVKDVSYFPNRDIYSWHLFWSLVMYCVICIIVVMFNGGDSILSFLSVFLTMVPAGIVGIMISIDYFFM